MPSRYGSRRAFLLCTSHQERPDACWLERCAVRRLRESPGVFKDRLFILGGIIANTRMTSEGFLIEALHVPVDRRGYLKEGGAHDRFLALFPKDSAILDPMIYRKDMAITLAGVFTGTRQGRIDEMDYLFPVFEIKDIYLWQQRNYYYPPAPYPYW